MFRHFFGSFVVALMLAAPVRGELTEQSCAGSPVELYAELAPRVVQIIIIGIDPFRVAGRVSSASGSGILLSETTVLTNYHVVSGGQLIAVASGDWTQEARLVGSDPALDVAVLELSEPVKVGPPLRAAKYDELVIGQSAYVIGFPLGVGSTMTSGIVSGLDRLLPINTVSWTTRYIQTDAPISPGNSGGALLDACGRIIGLVTLRSGNPGAENMGYALPFEKAMELVDEILDHGHVKRPWHGIYGQMVSPLIQSLMGGWFGPSGGFLVETVEPGSAADEAGIKGGVLPLLWGNNEIILGGDVILEVNGQPIETLDVALAVVGGLEIGQSVDVVVWRDGKILNLTATIKERPPQESDIWVHAGD